MKNNSPSFFQQHKKLLLFALFIPLIGIGAYFLLKKERSKDYNQQYSKYIEAFTSGTVSKKSNIRVHLANQVKTMSDVGVADERDLFSFSPSVKGKTYWIDAQTVEFRPEESLKPGETYEATFNLNKVTETDEGLETFEFDFRVITPGIHLTQNGLVSQNNTSMDYMKLIGEVTTSDQEDTKLIEKVLKVEFPQSLKVKWQHDPAKNASTFTVDSIKKTSRETPLKLVWSGDPIGAEGDKSKGEETVAVPAAGVFKVLDIRAVQDLEDFALVQFSEPINVGQDLNGLLSLSGLSDLRFTIDASQIKIYSPIT